MDRKSSLWLNSLLSLPHTSLHNQKWGVSFSLATDFRVRFSALKYGNYFSVVLVLLTSLYDLDFYFYLCVSVGKRMPMSLGDQREGIRWAGPGAPGGSPGEC